MGTKRQRIQTVELGGGQTATITDFFESLEPDKPPAAFPVFDVEELEEPETDCIPFDKCVPKPDTTLPCQGCVFQFGKRKFGGKKNPMDLVYQVFLENQDVPEAHLAELVSQAFDKYVVLPRLEQGEDIDPWVPSKVLEHITEHEILPTLQIRSDIRTLNQMSTMVKNRINTKGGSVDGAMVTLTLNISRQKLALLGALKNATVG